MKYVEHLNFLKKRLAAGSTFVFTLQIKEWYQSSYLCGKKVKQRIWQETNS